MSCEKLYKMKYGKYSGFIFPQIGSSISLQFINLNNTFLDNRGY